MGDSNKIILPFQKKVVDQFLKNKDSDEINKIAFLGSRKHNLEFSNTVESYCKMKFNANHIDTYDILDDGWDLNNDWNIKGYDLVICLRATPFIKSKNHFFTQLKACCDDNKRVLFDFTIYSGSISKNNDDEFKSLIPPFSNRVRLPPHKLETLSYDFRNQISKILQYRLILFYGMGLKYLKNEMINSFNYEDLVNSSLVPKNSIYYFNHIKRDLLAFLYWD